MREGRNMKIYGIQVGEYSDYTVVGYCTSEESAKRRCAVKNKGNNGDLYTYFELDCLDCDEPVDVWYLVKALVSIKIYGPGKKYNEPGLKYNIFDEPAPVIGYKKPEYNMGQFKKFKHGYITVRVKENNTELIEKVLYDTFYQYLAEVNALT